MAIKTNENFIPFSNRVTFRQPWGTDLVTAFWIDTRNTRNTRLLSVKVNCPDPWVASHDQKPDMGIASGIKSPPLARIPPPPPTGFTLIGALVKGVHERAPLPSRAFHRVSFSCLARFARRTEKYWETARSLGSQISIIFERCVIAISMVTAYMHVPYIFQ